MLWGIQEELVWSFRKRFGWARVALDCNPGYLGGRDQENHSSKPTWANSSQDTISKKPFQK
jgi:hypothetical protein